MNFKRWTVGKKLWFLAIVSALVLFGVEMFYKTTSNRLASDLSRISGSDLPAIRYMTLADMMHDGLRAVVFRAIIATYSKDAKELEEAKVEYAEMSKNISDYLAEIAKAGLSEEINQGVRESAEKVRDYVIAGQEVLKQAEVGDMEAAMRQLPNYQAAFKDLEERMEVLGEKIEAYIQKDIAASEAAAAKANYWGLIIAILGSALGLFVSVWINFDLVKTLRSMVGRLRSQGEALKGYSDEVGGSAQNLSSSSSQQAAAVQETASAIEEINAMVAKTAENSQRLAKSSQSSGDAVEAGRTAVEQMLTEMETIKQSNTMVMTQVEQSNSQIKGIVQVIGEIGEKTKVINDIVFQTKLLSFNASVEAARAGEHGKGFSVVAEEVGNLAQMSGTAAKDITQMLENGMRQVSAIVDSNRARISTLMEESARKVENGKRVADQCGLVFGKIVEQVAEVSRLSAEITTAIDEQRSGLDEINKAIGLFSESTQANSATANSTSEVSQHLQESVQELGGLMGELEFLVNGIQHTLSERSDAGPPAGGLHHLNAEQRMAS